MPTPMDERGCAHCHQPVLLAEPYVYVHVQPFRCFLEPTAEHTVVYHAACYERVRPSSLPDAGYRDRKRSV